METIEIRIWQKEVLEEVAKNTDYTGTKLMDSDSGARERILATDDDLKELMRFWDEAAARTNESLKEFLIAGKTVKSLTGDGKQTEAAYQARLEVASRYNQNLNGSLETAVRGHFIAWITAQWFRLANKAETAEYLTMAQDYMEQAERLLSSRRRPERPTS